MENWEFDEGLSQPAEQTESLVNAEQTVDLPADLFEQTTSNQAVSEQYTLKHLGEEKKVNLQEMQTLAQKGLDYERIRPKYDEMKGYRADAELVNHLAAGLGLSTEQYRAVVPDLLAQVQQLDALTQAGLDEKTAVQICVAEQNRQQQGAAYADDLRQLLELYPQVEKLPPTVLREIEQGTKPTIAYNHYLIEQQKNEILQLERNRKNSTKSVGSLRGHGSFDEDPFITGLFSE